MSKEQHGFDKINKTISFTPGDNELVVLMQRANMIDKDYKFKKDFNFNKYIKDLIYKDLTAEKEVFSDEQKELINKLIQEALKDLNLSELSATLEHNTLTLEDELKSVVVDSETNEALEAFDDM